MTYAEITSRCRNCGDARKSHGVKKPWRCATRLKESYWEPWTVEAYQAAVAAGKRAAGVSQEEDGENCWACGNVLGLCTCGPQEEP